MNCRTTPIELEELRQFFTLNAEQASRELGCSIDTLKKTCRKLGIRRWPYRQIKSIHNMISVYEYLLSTESDAKIRGKCVDTLVQLIPVYENIVNTGIEIKSFSERFVSPNYKIVSQYIYSYEYNKYIESLENKPDIRMTVNFLLN